MEPTAKPSSHLVSEFTKVPDYSTTVEAKKIETTTVTDESKENEIESDVTIKPVETIIKDQTTSSSTTRPTDEIDTSKTMKFEESSSTIKPEITIVLTSEKPSETTSLKHTLPEIEVSTKKTILEEDTTLGEKDLSTKPTIHLETTSKPEEKSSTIKPEETTTLKHKEEISSTVSEETTSVEGKGTTQIPIVHFETSTEKEIEKEMTTVSSHGLEILQTTHRSDIVSSLKPEQVSSTNLTEEHTTTPVSKITTEKIPSVTDNVITEKPIVHFETSTEKEVEERSTTVYSQDSEIQMSTQKSFVSVTTKKQDLEPTKEQEMKLDTTTKLPIAEIKHTTESISLKNETESLGVITTIANWLFSTKKPEVALEAITEYTSEEPDASSEEDRGYDVEMVTHIKKLSTKPRFEETTISGGKLTPTTPKTLVVDKTEKVIIEDGMIQASSSKPHELVKDDSMTTSKSFETTKKPEILETTTKFFRSNITESSILFSKVTSSSKQTTANGSLSTSASGSTASDRQLSKTQRIEYEGLSDSILDIKGFNLTTEPTVISTKAQEKKIINETGPTKESTLTPKTQRILNVTDEFSEKFFQTTPTLNLSSPSSRKESGLLNETFSSFIPPTEISHDENVTTHLEKNATEPTVTVSSTTIADKKVDDISKADDRSTTFKPIVTTVEPVSAENQTLKVEIDSKKVDDAKFNATTTIVPKAVESEFVTTSSPLVEESTMMVTKETIEKKTTSQLNETLATDKPIEDISKDSDINKTKDDVTDKIDEQDQIKNKTDQDKQQINLTEDKVDESPATTLKSDKLDDNQSHLVQTTTVKIDQSTQEQRVTTFTKCDDHLLSRDDDRTRSPEEEQVDISPTGNEHNLTIEEAAKLKICVHSGKIYQSAEQIPSSNPCDFCFCFRGDIICLQQTCPPPIPGCVQTPIKGFCCPRYECPIQLTTINVTTTTPLPLFTTTTTQMTTTREVKGCEVNNKFYEVGEVVRPASGPCMECKCDINGLLLCDPRQCAQRQPIVLRMNRSYFSAKR